MNKLLILLIFIVNPLYAFNVFNSGELVEKSRLNDNILEINNYLSNYSIDNYFNLFQEEFIISEEFNSNINKLNQEFNLSLDLINSGENLSASKINGYFDLLVNNIENNLYFSGCENRNNTDNGIYLIDYDGFLGDAPISEYCNYEDGINNLNNFRVEALSSDYERGSTNYVRVNGIQTSHGRGVGIVVYDKNLVKIHNARYDTYYSNSASTALYNDLGNTNKVPLNSMIVVTVSDSAANYLGFSSRLKSLFGCDISSLGQREAYICISYKNSLGQKNRVYQNFGNQVYTSQHIDFSQYYDFLSP